MFFLLSLIVTGILGWFMPIWLYDVTWIDLFSFLNEDAEFNTKIFDFLDRVGYSGIFDNADQFIKEKIFIAIAIVIGILIAMLIITTVIKKAIRKK